MLFKVWDRTRSKKKFIVAESLNELRQKGCEKFGVVRPRVVTESDGTEVEEDEVLAALSNEVLIILGHREVWEPSDAAATGPGSPLTSQTRRRGPPGEVPTRPPQTSPDTGTRNHIQYTRSQSSQGSGEGYNVIRMSSTQWLQDSSPSSGFTGDDMDPFGFGGLNFSAFSDSAFNGPRNGRPPKTTSTSTRFVNGKKVVTKRVVDNGVETVTVEEDGQVISRTVNGQEAETY